MYKKTYYEMCTCISPHMPTCTCSYSTIHTLAYQNLVLNGRGSLKLLHLYGNLAIVVTTSDKLVAEPRQACTCMHNYGTYHH